MTSSNPDADFRDSAWGGPLSWTTKKIMINYQILWDLSNYDLVVLIYSLSDSGRNPDTTFLIVNLKFKQTNEKVKVITNLTVNKHTNKTNKHTKQKLKSSNIQPDC